MHNRIWAMQVSYRFLLVTLLFLASFTAKAQLKVDTSYSVENMVSKILMGKGVKIGNIHMRGSKQGIGYFHVNSDVIGMRNGLLLSTGRVHDAIGPNNVPGRSGVVTTAKEMKSGDMGDRDLNALCGNRTKDVMVLEFDFIPTHNRVSFRYSFGSEEYREYVGSRFNDVFGFFIEGPGLPKRNLAVIPGTDEPVAVNNVNHKKYRKIYLNNDYFVDVKNGKSPLQSSSQTGFMKVKNSIRHGAQVFHHAKTSLNEDAVLVDERERRQLNQELVAYFQYDGFTKVLTAECAVIPHKKYHLKLAIGDVGDYALDSGVFLEAGSFSSDDNPKLPVLRASVNAGSGKSQDTVLESNDLSTMAGNKADTEPVEMDRNIHVFRTTNVYFATDSYSIPDSAARELDQLAAHLLKNRLLSCQLAGHTDNVGDKRYNQALSENRAVAVVKYLISKGITRSRLVYNGNNFEDPIADNDQVNGRRHNRRVAITVVAEPDQVAHRQQ